MQVELRTVPAWTSFKCHGKHWTQGGYEATGVAIDCRDAYGSTVRFAPSTLVTLLEDRGKVCAEIKEAMEGHANERARLGRPMNTTESGMFYEIKGLIDEIAANPTRGE